jgi:hypothetical protein
MNQNQWRPMGFEGLRKRLVEVKKLLEQAAAVGMTQDVARLEAAAELERRARELEARGRPGRTRYR